MNETTVTFLDTDRLLKAVEVARILNISRALAYQLMKQRKINTVHIRGACRVRPVDLQKFIEEHLTPADSGRF